MPTEKVKKASSVFTLVTVAIILAAGMDWAQALVATFVPPDAMELLVGAFPFLALAILGIGMYTTLASEQRARLSPPRAIGRTPRRAD